jgi:hypothetical protein
VRPVQFHAGRAWFIETNLPAGTTRRYTLQGTQGGGDHAGTRLGADRQGASLSLRLDARPVAGYVAGPGVLPRPDIAESFRRGGYLHPVHTPSGRVITDDYPPNHIHHHGIWWAWTRTRFGGREPDFWNMGERKGRVDFVAEEGLVVGPVFSEVTARHAFTDLLSAPPVVALHETWRVRVLAAARGARFHLIDLDSEQVCATDRPLELPQYYYGGLGYRGPWEWNGAGNARYLDSNGVTQRVAANETRARWYWLGGQVDGRLAGVAVLGHPGNFRAPQPLRVHPREPFVCWAPSQLGDWAIRPGEVFRSRYRIVACDGEPDAHELDRLWADFAEPPAVR